MSRLLAGCVWRKADSRLHIDPSDADIRDQTSIVLSFITNHNNIISDG